MADEERIMPFIRAAHVVPEPPAVPKPRVSGQKEHERLFPGQPCFYCGDPAQSVDHKIPRSKGGQRGANLVPACHRCNQMKGDMTVDEFMAHMERVLETLRNKKVIQFGGKEQLWCPLAA